MPFEERQSNWIKLPKVGETADYSPHGAIAKIEKVENADHKKSKFNFVQKNAPILDNEGKPMLKPDGTAFKEDKDLGYFYRLTFTDGNQMNISDWGSFYALTDAGVKEGNVIVISHPIKGTWEITKK